MSGAAIGGLDPRLAALLDREEIRELRLRYSRCLDSGDFDAFDSVFAADARVIVTVGEMQGTEAIEAGLADAYRQFDRDGRGHYPFSARRRQSPDHAHGRR
ncbi:nuclear transport factor 2 family protein [Sphingomonas naphthae]|uniref:Nuclear transport factor 2 family protein n=1 Tax=Sphingomonas naphthae TaxID=1813468 RepID=A0ABY7TP85_9SPHN|nr:nuclear transport factor 2 family protein [Sphingomonas naphthae]WCT74442.1 nuclear transport factor 2 family protein [Sphingomonas naphthae]